MDEDQKLMVLVRNGDQRAFGRLYERFKGPIMSYVRQMVQNETRAEEVTQEVFLKVYRVRDSYEPTAKFSTWLWTIARNACLDELRKSGSRHEVSLETPANSEGQSWADQLEAPLTSAEQNLIEAADRTRIESCLSALPAQQREALTLRTVSELSYDEIAEAMDLTLAAVKTLIHRAKNSLTSCVERSKP